MDEGNNERQHDNMFAKLEKLTERVTKIEVYQKVQHKAHDKLEEKHGDELETHGKKISKHGELITRALAGGAVILFILDKMGVFDKFLG